MAKADRHYKNGPGHKFHLFDNPLLEENIIHNHGPLGTLYPKLAYIMEGDTPSFLGLIDNGLGWAESPSYGGWGGRYALYHASGENRPIWTNNQDSRDTVTADNGQATCSDQATVWRWREHFQHDFGARMDWCVADEFKKANHNPIAVLNDDASKRVLKRKARPGETVTFSAVVGLYPHAIRTIAEVTERTRAMGAKSNLANALGNLIDLEIKHGALDAARLHIKEFAELVPTLGDPTLETGLGEGYGDLTLAEGDAKTAIGYYKASVQIAQQAGLERANIVITKLGNAYLKNHDPLAALKTTTRAQICIANNPTLHRMDSHHRKSGGATHRRSSPTRK